MLCCTFVLCILKYGRMAMPNSGGKIMNQSINQIIMQYGGNLYCHTPTLCQRSSRLIKYFVASFQYFPRSGHIKYSACICGSFYHDPYACI